MKIKNWLATVAVISSAFVIGCSSETESSGKKVEEQQDAVQKIENITILKYKEMKFEEDGDGVYVASEPDGQVEIRFMDARGVENEVEKKAEQLVKEYESKKGVDAFVSKVSDICCDVPAIEMIDGKIESYRYTRIIYDEENGSLIVIEGTAGARMGDKHIKECVSSAELAK